jgi:hypothetical protein
MPRFAFFWKACSTYTMPTKRGINRPVGVAVEVIDQFQNGTAAKSFQRLRDKGLVTILNLTQGKAHAIPHLGRESLQVSAAGADKVTWFRRGPFAVHRRLVWGYPHIVVKGISRGAHCAAAAIPGIAAASSRAPSPAETNRISLHRQGVSAKVSSPRTPNRVACSHCRFDNSKVIVAATPPR